MKLFLKVSITLFTTLFLFNSCKNHYKVADPPPPVLPPAPVTIFVYVGISDDDSLIMSDGGYTAIEQGATINWEILPFSVNAESIIEIIPKAGNPNIWMPGKAPTRRPIIPPGIRDHWAGNTRPDLIPDGGDPFVYEYTIKWKDALGIEHIFDPTIKVEPNDQ